MTSQTGARKRDERSLFERLADDHPGLFDAATRDRVRRLLGPVVQGASIGERGQQLVDTAMAIDDAAGAFALALSILTAYAKEGGDLQEILDDLDAQASNAAPASGEHTGAHEEFAEPVVESLRDAGYLKPPPPRPQLYSIKKS